MIKLLVLILLFFSFFTIETSGQIFPKEYWKEIADDSKAIIVGTVENRYQVIRPEKFKPNPDGSSPSDEEIYMGKIFRVKITKKLKGKIKTEKNGENEYVNIFLFWITGVPASGDPVLFKGKEYVLFLEPNNEKELEGKETVEFKLGDEIIRRPFDYKTTYLVVHGFRGAVEIKNDRNKLIKEIKKAID